MFEYAIENRAIDFNPLKYVKISKNAAKKKERRALSPEEQKLIINTPHRGRLPAMIMLLAGLRRGECLGLQWADIDLKRNKINVHQTLVLDGNNSYIKAGAKTEAGVRKVDIPCTYFSCFSAWRTGGLPNKSESPACGYFLSQIPVPSLSPL